MAMVEVLIHQPPRRFRVGIDDWVTLSDCMRIMLAAGEMAELRDESGRTRLQVHRASWGFVLPLALNDAGTDGEAVIAGRDADSLHLMIVDNSRRPRFDRYMRRDGLKVLASLATPATGPGQ